MRWLPATVARRNPEQLGAARAAASGNETTAPRHHTYRCHAEQDIYSESKYQFVDVRQRGCGASRAAPRASKTANYNI